MTTAAAEAAAADQVTITRTNNEGSNRDRQRRRRRRRTEAVVSSSFVHLSFDVWVPKNVSSLSHLFDNNHTAADTTAAETETPCLYLYCHRPGVLWHCLVPMIMGGGAGRDAEEEESSSSSCNESQTKDRSSSRNQLVGADSPSPAQNILSILLKESWNNQSMSLQRTLENAFIMRKEQRQETLKEELDEFGTAANLDDPRLSFQRQVVTVSLSMNLLLPMDSNLHNHNYRITTIPTKTEKIRLFLLPTPDNRTSTCFLDRTFTGVVLTFEKTLLQKQTMTAWMATLGGGYFFIKRLSHSLVLARQQRLLALQIGNISMARQCQLNEAYNWIYAGKFRQAKLVLKSLEAQAVVAAAEGDHKGESQRMLRQCHAARILLKRLKMLGSRLKRYKTDNNPGDNNKINTINNNNKDKISHTVDDFQRVRIVVESH